MAFYQNQVIKLTHVKTLIKLNIISALRSWELTQHASLFPRERETHDARESRSLIDTCQSLIEEDA